MELSCRDYGILDEEVTCDLAEEEEEEELEITEREFIERDIRKLEERIRTLTEQLRLVEDNEKLGYRVADVPVTEIYKKLKLCTDKGATVERKVSKNLPTHYEVTNPNIGTPTYFNHAISAWLFAADQLKDENENDD